MNQEMLDLAAQSLKIAKTAGANQCRVVVWRGRTVEISYRERKPRRSKKPGPGGSSSRSLSTAVTRVRARRDLRPAALDAFITRRWLPRSSRRGPVPESAGSEILRRPARPRTWVWSTHRMPPSPGGAAPDGPAIEAACFAHGGPKIISVTASCSDTSAESVLLSSNGLDGSYAATYFSAGAEITLQDEGERRPNGYHFVSAVSRPSLPAAEQIGAEAARRTLDLLGAKKIKTETMPVIIENRSVPRLLGGLLSAMSGRNIQQQQSF